MTEEPKTGDNMSPDKLALYHIGKVAHAAERKGQGDAGLRNAFSRADQDGVDIEAIKIARKIAKSDEPGAKLETLKRAVRYCQLLDIDEAKQMDLFAVAEPDRAPDDERAFSLGHRHGLSGENAENPYALGTAQYERYEAGYHEGYQTLTAFDAGSEVAQIARKKSGADDENDEDASIIDVEDEAA